MNTKPMEKYRKDLNREQGLKDGMPALLSYPDAWPSIMELRKIMYKTLHNRCDGILGSTRLLRRWDKPAHEANSIHGKWRSAC